MWLFLGPMLALMTAGLVGGAFVRAPYVMQAPGSARSTEPLISVPDGRGNDSQGEILFTTVSVIRPTFVEAVWGWLNDDVSVFPRKVQYGDQSDEETRRQSQEDMNQSKLLAAKVALERLGYDVAVSGTGVVLLQVAQNVPAAEVLEAGDVVVAADGEPITYDEQLIDLIAARDPGDVVSLTVERQGEKGRRTVEAELAARPGTDDAMLGVVIETRDLKFDLPLDIDIDSGEVGGPSAGLAFSLGVIDRLTPGSLTGGKRVAVTGAIASDGRVLDVGGVEQKAVAARRAGAVLFLVPPGEYEQALRTAGDMDVVKVSTLEEALDALADAGGNADELDPPPDDGP